jgi:hypothetical protein
VGNLRVVRDPHNLSHSRLKNFMACATRAGYESFYDGRSDLGVPYWLVGGTATHYIVDQLIEKTVASGNVLGLESVDKIVLNARAHLRQALSGKIPPKGHQESISRLKVIMWMTPEEKEGMAEAEYKEFVDGRMWRYIHGVLPAIRAVALRCAVSSPFKETHNAIRFDKKVNLVSPRNPNIRIPLYGEIDLAEINQQGGWIITDWKTGKLDYFNKEELEGNGQMLVYYHGIRELFGVFPWVSYFVSLNIYKDDVEKYGAAVLERERYRLQAEIRYHEHFPELLREMDDVWAVLNFLAYPPRDATEQLERDSWWPSSAIGVKSGLRRHLDQNRLIPSIGKHCGMCPARQLCQEDNPEDWQEYRLKQKLGNVVEPVMEFPEEWVEPDHMPVKPHSTQEVEDANAYSGQQRKLFALGRPLQRHKLKSKQWKALGFFTPKEIVGQLNKMVDLIPLTPKGEMCPCKKTRRIPEFFVPHAVKFWFERENHKIAQELEGKTRSGEGKDKVRDLYDSQTVRELLRFCRVPDCPFAERNLLESEPILMAEEPT